MFQKQTLVKGILFGLLTLTTFLVSALPTMAMPAGPLIGGENTVDRPALGWLTGWSYRRTVTIANSGSTLTDYQIRVALDGSFTWNHAKSDGSDLRFTAVNGTTLLSFWIESWDPPNSASIWVKVPTIPNGSSTIFLYHGNNSATALSNGPNTFILFDNGWATTLNPVHSATQSWWEVDVTYPMIFEDASFLPSRPRYHMLFDGHKNPTYQDSKGYAYSSDLTTWTEYDGGTPHPPNPNPIIGPGYPGNNNYAWGDTIKVGSTYHMFTVRGALTNPTAVHAQSANLINWTDSLGGTPSFDVLTTNDPFGIGTGVAVLKEADGITPVVVDNKYWMVYFHGSSTNEMYLAYADTSNLLSWTVCCSGNPILTSGPNTWERDGFWTPSFVRVNNKYYLYYQGIQNGVGWQLGFASADAYNVGNPVRPDNVTWTKSPNNPVVTKTHGWDSGGCQDPILRYFNGTYYLFYTGQGLDGYDRNGFATSSSPEGPWTQYCPSDGCGLNWARTGVPTVSNGIISFTNAQAIGSPSDYSPSVALGFRARFQNAQNFKWGGFISGSMAPFLVIETNGSSLILAAQNSGDGSSGTLNSNYLGNFNIYEIAWLGSSGRVYMNHSATPEVSLTTDVPSGPLPVQFNNFNDTSATLDIDWVYLRQFRDPEPTIIALGNESPTSVALSSFGARTDKRFDLLLIVGLALTVGGVIFTGWRLRLAQK